MSQAMIPAQREVSTQPIANIDAQAKETKRVVFFAGDAITSREKFEMPNVKGEGIYMPQIRTLPKSGENHGSKGMIHRCQFTSLQVDMKPEWEVMLPPGERKHYPQAFITEDGNGKSTVSGWVGSHAGSIREGIFKGERHGDVRYHKVLPGDEIRRVVERSQPHGVGGVVEIEALRGASAATIEEAQRFFFPEWDEIRTGSSSLPPTIRELEAHIRARSAEVSLQGWSTDKVDAYSRIASDMLKSCTTFRLSALEIVEKDDIVKQDAAKNGVTAPHSPVSEHLLPQIEYKRKGDLLAGEANSTAELVREMRADRQAQSSSKDKEMELREKELDLERLKLELELKRMANPTPTPVPEPVLEPVIDEPRLCGSPVVNGGTCKRELNEGETMCFQHAPKIEKVDDAG